MAKILVVDDSDLMLALVCRVLRDCGYNIEEADNGKEALKKYQEAGEPFDLVITDINMPQMTGIDLARQISCLNPQQRIILMSTDLALYREQISDLSERPWLAEKDTLADPKFEKFIGVVRQALVG